MPVSEVIKALKLGGLWKYRRGYTECVCRVVGFHPRRSIDVSTVWPIMLTGLYSTNSISLTAPTNTQMTDIYGKCDKNVPLSKQSTVCPLGFLYADSIIFYVMDTQANKKLQKNVWLLDKSGTESCSACFRCAISDLCTCNSKQSLRSKETDISGIVSNSQSIFISCIFKEMNYWTTWQSFVLADVHYLFGGRPVTDLLGVSCYTGRSSLLDVTSLCKKSSFHFLKLGPLRTVGAFSIWQRLTIFPTLKGVKLWILVGLLA